ncbi:MAG TPA: GTP 3',8-cyclase MoaA [Candidatus Bathyarchaeota archaeon]|nr:GTP 3',8-cyclase MoaA [Candidatus Bathyarchaeota archaeon]
MTLRDNFGRPVENIRISVTQKCNFRCIYCHREGQQPNFTVEMSAEEIERIVRVAASLGVWGAKLTGGEPLLRNDIIEIVQRISGISGIKDVSITTNGFFLAQYADQLKEAGLSRVNVSLDTLNPEKFKAITGVDAHENVVEGIIKAAKAGLNPVKVNMVLLKGINEDEVEDMIKFAGEHNLILQIIELERANEDNFYAQYHVDLNHIEKKLRERATKIVVRRMHHRRKYILDGDVEVEIVRPMHNSEFCLHCNRIRLTSDGKLKPCLFRNDNLVDLLGPMRNGAGDEQLKELFIKAVKARKPFFT